MYETFEHTADVGIRARAGSLDELFAEVAKGLFFVMLANPEAVRAVEEVTFALSGDDVEELLHDWLAELLYTFCARRLVLAEFQVRVAEAREIAASDGGTSLRLSHPTRLTATARGEPIDLRRHEIDVEVKAITWCGFKVERTADGWMTEVIVDI